VIELLTQLSRHDVATRQCLATALYRMGRYDEALVHERTLLESAVAQQDSSLLKVCLQRISNTLDADLRHAEASRYRALLKPLVRSLRQTGDVYLYQALRSIDRGECKKAMSLLDQAEHSGNARLRMFDGEITIARLRLAERSGHLTIFEITQAKKGVTSWSQRADLAGIAARLHARQLRIDEALAAIQEQHRIYRAGGIDTVPAFDAWCLAQVRRHSEACDAVADALARITTLDPRNRPHRELAQALHKLGRNNEAAEQAQLAYRLAWGDGPPNVMSAWDLEEAVKLLDKLGLKHPVLPTIDPSTVNPQMGDMIAPLIRRATRRWPIWT
jgi:tetratricopeptide (TPR) repeat protein